MTTSARPENMPDGLDWAELGRRCQLVARAADRAELWRLALAALTEVLGADAAAVWSYESLEDRLRPAAEQGFGRPGEPRPRWADLLKLPLTSGGLLVGVIEVYSHRPESFGAAHRAALQLLGSVLATRLHALRLSDQISRATSTRAADELDLLWSLTAATRRVTTYEELFNALPAALRAHFEFDVCALYLPVGPRPACLVALHGQGHRGLVAEVAEKAAQALEALGGPGRDTPAPPPREIDGLAPAAGPPLGAGFAVPLTQDGQPVGVLYLGALAEQAFDQGQIRVLKRFAEHVSASLDRLRGLLTVEVERLETIIASLPQGIVLLDAEGEVLMANRHGAGQLRLMGAGEPRVAVLGGVPLAELIEEAVAGGIDLTRREIVLRTNEQTCHLAVTVVPVRDAGQLIGTVLSIEDVTGLRQTEQRLFHDARLAAIGEFASGLAHELNNPMMIILGISEVLAEDEALSDHRRGQMQMLQDAVLRADTIVKQLMIFADSQRDLGWDAVDLDEILDQALRMVTSQCQQEGVEVSYEPAPELPLVQGNAGKLQQIVLSLLRNAREAIAQSGAGGRIVVRTKRLGERVAVEVEDDGPGVPAELRARIFDVFFTTKRDFQGKGLGLSVAWQLAKEHDGQLTVDDAPGGGALFRLTLPAHHFGDEVA